MPLTALSTSPLAALLLLLGFQAKHYLFDFVLQSDWQVHNKGTYGHPGGLVHSGLQAFGTLMVMLVATLSGFVGFGLAIAITVADFLIHYHVDYTKAQISKRLDLKPQSKSYWVAFGADQAAHQATYVGLLAAMFVLA